MPWFILLGFSGPLSSQWFESSERRKFRQRCLRSCQSRVPPNPPFDSVAGPSWRQSQKESVTARDAILAKAEEKSQGYNVRDFLCMGSERAVTRFFNSLSVASHCPGRAVSLLERVGVVFRLSSCNRM